MCKLTLRNHTHKRFKRKWVNQQEKKKLITYGKWSYSNNNFSEEVHTLLEFCSTFKNTLLLWLLLWTSKVTNNLYNNSFVPEYLTYFSLHICVYITTPLRRKAKRLQLPSPSFSTIHLMLYLWGWWKKVHIRQKLPQLAYTDALLASKEEGLSVLNSLCVPERRSFERKVWITDMATDAGYAVVSLQVSRGIHAHSVLFSTMLQTGLRKIYEQFCLPPCSMPKNQKKRKLWKNRQHFARLAILCDVFQLVKTRTVHPVLNPSTSTLSHLLSPCG